MKDIIGYEGLYAITEDGRVYSYRTSKYLKPGMANGYYQVCLCKDGSKTTHKIHRLVAENLIPNPEGKREVNHINAIRTDNRVENLEWTTTAENNQKKDMVAKMKSANAAAVAKYKRIYCIELNTVYESLKEAGKQLKLNASALSNCLTGRSKTCGGYHWRYADE